MALTTTWYILAPIDQLCFSCPVPRRCNEAHHHCLRRLALAAGNVSRRTPHVQEVRVLDYLEKHPDTYFTGTDLANAIDAPRKATITLLHRLKAKDKVSHIGRGHTSRWTAKDSPSNTV